MGAETERPAPTRNAKRRAPEAAAAAKRTPKKRRSPAEPRPGQLERKRRRAARRSARESARRRRAARRRARILRAVVLVETGLRRLGRILVPATTRRIPRAKALLVLVLNIAPFPGLGTVMYGKLERGIVQFLLTFVFLIGWFWAIADGVRIVHRAFASSRRRGGSGRSARTR